MDNRDGSSRGFSNPRDNRNNRNGFRGNNSRGFGGPREMHKAVCSKCKQECEVPFKPTEGRDVFCKDCFVKH